eukprot:1161681-Pelagomonas_calceolata.AAC.15
MSARLLPMGTTLYNTTCAQGNGPNPSQNFVEVQQLQSDVCKAAGDGPQPQEEKLLDLALKPSTKVPGANLGIGFKGQSGRAAMSYMQMGSLICLHCDEKGILRGRVAEWRQAMHKREQPLPFDKRLGCVQRVQQQKKKQAEQAAWHLLGVQQLRVSCGCLKVLAPPGEVKQFFAKSSDNAWNPCKRPLTQRPRTAFSIARVRAAGCNRRRAYRLKPADESQHTNPVHVYT